MATTRGAHADGLALGIRIEHNVARGAIATAALRILGKDAADGVIDLGALGRWHATDGQAVEAHNDAAAEVIRWHDLLVPVE